MAITILAYNYSGGTGYNRVLSVYNPITFTVDSTRRTREGFKYVADIYYSGTTTDGQQFVSRLESYPNLNNFYGLFDIHRPLESVLTSDVNYNCFEVERADNSYNNFRAKFGEKFSVQNRFSSVGNSGGFLRLNFDSPHALSLNDRVLIDKDNKGVDGNYNGVAEVNGILNANDIRVDIPFGTGGTAQTGYVIEGTEFWDTAFQGSQSTGFICTNNPNVQIGDTIVINKDDKSLNSSYDGEWAVLDLIDYLGDTIVVTNCPWGQNSTAESGMLYLKGDKVFSGLSTSIEYSWILNSVNDYEDERGFGKTRSFYEYALTGTTNKFLTPGPKVQKLREDDYQTVSFLSHHSLPGKITQIKVELNHISGGTNAYDFFLGPFYADSGAVWNNLRFDVGVGPKNLNLAVDNSIISGSSIDFSTIDSIDVYAYSTATTSVVSATYKFEIDRECSRYETYRFMWLNRLGAFDYYNFRKRSDTTYEIDKSTYQKKLGNFKTGNPNYGYNIGDRGSVVNNVKINETVSVNSDWVTEAESKWLYELFQSPEVYVIDGDNILPITIRNNSYTEGKRENQKLFNYKVDFVYAFNKFSQRG